MVLWKCQRTQRVRTNSVRSTQFPAPWCNLYKVSEVHLHYCLKNSLRVSTWNIKKGFKTQQKQKSFEKVHVFAYKVLFSNATFLNKHRHCSLLVRMHLPVTESSLSQTFVKKDNMCNKYEKTVLAFSSYTCLKKPLILYLFVSQWFKRMWKISYKQLETQNRVRKIKIFKEQALYKLKKTQTRIMFLIDCTLSYFYFCE